MTLRQFTEKQVSAWIVNYWRSGRNKIEPFGQAFCNDHNLTNPDLFNETSEEKAVQIIIDTYLI
jgi:hypothetical protein